MTTETAVKFFFDNAGYSFDPATETAEQGRQRCALALATAEESGRDAGLSFEWEVDHDSNSRDFAKGPRYDLWGCICRDGDGETAASLWGVDFGRDGQPWGDKYRRVVEAELAAETLANQKEAA